MLANLDFADFGGTSGGEGYRVEKPQELDDVLEKAFASDKSVIVEVVVNPDRSSPIVRAVPRSDPTFLVCRVCSSRGTHKHLSTQSGSTSSQLRPEKRDHCPSIWKTSRQ